MKRIGRQIRNLTASVQGVDVFYREAGDHNNPSVLLLHGFPTSSVMFKNLMVALSDRFHLVAPDYPGFGFSAFPAIDDFEYSFENIAAYIAQFTETIGLRSFAVYLHDYGCPIGLRICVRHPEKITAIIVQNGNAYMEGIGPQWDETRDYWDHPTEAKKKKVSAFLTEEGIREQYTAGLTEELLSRISPEIVGTGLGADAQTRERRDAVGVELYVQDEPRDVSCVSGLLPEASTSRADHLGKARCVFRCCRGPLLQTRYAPGRGSYPRRWSQSARDKFS